MSGCSSTNVYALGHAGTLLHYDGTLWTVSIPFHAPLSHWSALLCVSPRDIFVVGYSRSIVGGSRVYEYYMYHFDGSVVSPMSINSTAPIHDLWGTSVDNVLAAGGGGMIQRYDGSSWTPIESGTTEDIYAISGLPTGELFAALQHSVLYYDGTSWTEILTTSESLNDIWASSRDDVYAVGPNGTVLHYDGRTWTLTRMPYGPIFNTVMGSTSNDVYVAGGNVIYHYDGQGWRLSHGMYSLAIRDLWESPDGEVFVVGSGEDERVPPTILHFDGATWNQERSEYLLPFNRDLTAISGNDQDIYVGGDYIGLLRFDGSSWRNIYMDDGAPISDLWSGPGNTLVAIGDYGLVALLLDGTRLRVAHFPEGLAHVWGGDSSDIFFVGWDGAIAHFDGTTLVTMESNTTVGLNDVWGRSGSEVYTVGEDGTILHYDGKSWQLMVSNTTESLQAIWGDSQCLVAVGAQGTILHFENGKWTPMTSPSTDTLTGIWGESSRDIYAVGAHVSLHYDGSRWTFLSETLGGSRVWGRAGDDVYVIQPYRILHYGPRHYRAI